MPGVLPSAKAHQPCEKTCSMMNTPDCLKPGNWVRGTSPDLIVEGEVTRGVWPAGSPVLIGHNRFYVTDFEWSLAERQREPGDPWDNPGRNPHRCHRWSGCVGVSDQCVSYRDHDGDCWFAERPKPVLRDGIYQSPDGWQIRERRNGLWRWPDQLIKDEAQLDAERRDWHYVGASIIAGSGVDPLGSAPGPSVVEVSE